MPVGVARGLVRGRDACTLEGMWWSMVKVKRAVWGRGAWEI